MTADRKNTHIGDSGSDMQPAAKESLRVALGGVASMSAGDQVATDPTHENEQPYAATVAEIIDRVEGMRAVMDRHLNLYPEERARDDQRTAIDTMLRSIDGLIAEQYFDHGMYDTLQGYRERYTASLIEIGKSLEYTYDADSMARYVTDYVTPIRGHLEEKVLIPAVEAGGEENVPAWAVRIRERVGELAARMLQFSDRLSELDYKDKQRDDDFRSMRLLLDDMKISSFDASEMNALRSRVSDLKASIEYANSARERVGREAADIRRDCDAILTVLDNIVDGKPSAQ